MMSTMLMLTPFVCSLLAYPLSRGRNAKVRNLRVFFVLLVVDPLGE
jgi:hypothetical protein